MRKPKNEKQLKAEAKRGRKRSLRLKKTQAEKPMRQAKLKEAKKALEVKFQNHLMNLRGY